MVQVASQSTNTGEAHSYMIGFADALKVRDEQITSSPESTPSNRIARRRPPVPDEGRRYGAGVSGGARFEG